MWVWAFGFGACCVAYSCTCASCLCISFCILHPSATTCAHTHTHTQGGAMSPTKPLGRPPTGRNTHPPPQSADQCMTGHQGSVMCMQVLGNTLYSGGFDGAIKVWNLDDCRCLQSVPAHVKPVRQLTIQQGLLYSTACQKSRVWDLSDMTCLRVVQAPRRNGHQWVWWCLRGVGVWAWWCCKWWWW